MMDLLWLLIQDAFWSGLAAMGFAILFSVPRRALVYCVIAGALGHALRTLMMHQFGWSIELATLIGATAVGFMAKVCAIRLEMPSMIFGVSGAIPMVPGAFAYRTMMSLLQISIVSSEDVSRLLISASTNGIKTGLILAALAVGIVAPTLLFQRDKPVV